MAFNFNLSKGEEVLLKAGSIGAAVLGVFAVYTFYRNNVWHPKVKVLTVDYPNGVAELEINGRKFTLRGDSSYLIAFDWGIKFGFTPTADGRRVYDRIEVLKRGLVHSVLDRVNEKPKVGFTADEKSYWNDVFEGGKGSLIAAPRAFTGSEKAIVNDVWGVKDGDGFSIFKGK